jgi:glycosyltransferase involved in cell wall biosynthesis
VKRLSVIVPCRNERRHVEGFLASLRAQRLPEGWSVEWLIADGGSDDGTREWLDACAAGDARLRVLDNPRRFVSCGLNACLSVASGNAIARMDVHTDYADDYLAQCVATLARTGADNVGGAWVAVGTTPGERAVAAAFQSGWVVGGARSRDATYEGPVETVYLGCWPRATFDRFGTFDESLVRNQDDEHNLRIVRGGGRIWQNAAIHSTYRPRGRIAQLFAQQRQYGYWRIHVLRKHGTVASWRQLVPAAFIAAVASALLLVAFAGMVPLVVILGVYALYVGAASAHAASRSDWNLGWRLPAVIVAFHSGYGIGTWQGLLAAGLGRPPSPGQTGLTR